MDKQATNKFLQKARVHERILGTVEPEKKRVVKGPGKKETDSCAIAMLAQVQHRGESRLRKAGKINATFRKSETVLTTNNVEKAVQKI